MKKEVFKIQGMHCASCVKIIERALSKLSGTKSAVVNFAAETVLIEYDEEKIKSEDFAKVISDVGYKLEIAPRTAEPALKGGRKTENKRFSSRTGIQLYFNTGRSRLR